MNINLIQKNQDIKNIPIIEGNTLMQTIQPYVNSETEFAQCGGLCECATCHVYIEEVEFFPPPNDYETELLTFADNVNSISRLSCQIKFTRSLTKDLTVIIPDDKENE